MARYDRLLNAFYSLTLVNSVAFSPDGQLIASGSDDATIKVWKSDGTLVATKHLHRIIYKARRLQNKDFSV